MIPLSRARRFASKPLLNTLVQLLIISGLLGCTADPNPEINAPSDEPIEMAGERAEIELNLGECIELRPEDECTPNDPAMASFWSLIHEARYEGIDAAIETLKSALEETPDDLNAHKAIGFFRSWQLAEAGRQGEVDLSVIVGGLQEASTHFQIALDQKDDPRVIIFKSTNEYMAAKALENEELERETKAAFLEAVESWPELSYFVGGTMLSIFSQPGDEDFERALEYMWLSLDLCAGEEVTRQDPLAQMAEHIQDVRRPGRQRACSNSWIAPHSFEGFWMFFGDLLTKKGDFEVALVMYEFAKESQNYNTWRYQDVLDERIENLEANHINFALPNEEQSPKYHPIAEWSCTVCHQR